MTRVAFVLHSHLPWLRRNGTHPMGEEWLFQAWSESYLPLLDVLERLAADGHRDVLTLGITPVLAEQMADPYLLREFHGWLGRRLLDLQWSRSGAPPHIRPLLEEVWQHHWRRQTALLERAEGLLDGGLVAPFARLADEGVIELLGGPATHPYLPLMADDALLRGQIHGGMATATRHFGRRPAGVWTPECGYRPAGPVGDPTRPPVRVAEDGSPVLHPSGRELPGLEAFWAEVGVTHLVLDGPTLAVAAGAAPQDWSHVGGQPVPPGGPLDVLDGPVLVGDSDVAAFGRNLAVAYAVWNPHGGYPTHEWYRDFHTVDHEGGFKSWRVTDRRRLDKEPYHPPTGRRIAREHAEAFVALVHRHRQGRPDGTVVVAAFDTELFGHWWYEGPVWLEHVLRALHADPVLAPTTLARALEDVPPRRRLHLPESSWGWGKGHAAWVGEATRWVWQGVREAEARFRQLPAGPARDAAWRQLCLLQASDWPFLLSRDSAAQYATERVKTHLARFAQACEGRDLDGLAAVDDPAGTTAPAW